MTVGNKKLKKRQIIPILIIVGIIAFIVLPFISWLITDESITATSDAQFCVTCHSMGPFEKSHTADVHGGANDHGIRATCAQCHLPHDNSFNYLYTKAETGIHDLWVENFGDPENIDWAAKHEYREEFVYDSGCLTCHTNLEKATMASNKALIAHKPYFLGTTDDKCVTCHENVGHTDLNKYLSEAKDEE
ncbi:MAG: cytochrome C [Chloroflexi bacterium]|nr:cytochrome C [Chloroflexota bacterium]